ncbi:MAG: hypothetical protein A3K19_03555 [Lentisphaerae bacterium RIFOXYB12_FULL_65_16]|nr:MAG: hypothetical protein A3K18_30155 [Lentisphaerae bacterium RIFOXYA12_64_32]OGV86590.1 MAG: hypothetical protein A3K19_03555 [Lentisphaerae bacterium RIFOXYB12_FULL_65_16]
MGTTALEGVGAEVQAKWATVLAVDPENVQGLFGRGRARFAKRQYGPALADMDAVLRQTPTDSNAWLGKGLALLATGKKDDAQGCIDKSRKFSEAEVRQYIKDEAKVQERLKAWNKEIDSLVERVQKESAAKPQ